MDLKKISFEELCEMTDSFIGSPELDAEKARVFVENSTSHSIPHHLPLAYSLTHISINALKVEEYDLAARAYQKAFELAPSLEEVERITQSLGINYSDIKSIEIVRKRMKTMNNQIKVDY